VQHARQDAQRRGQPEQVARQQALAASYQALHDAYAEREATFAAVMADRADWDAATRAQRHLAVAADAELRRRHPARQYPPLLLNGAKDSHGFACYRR